MTTMSLSNIISKTKIEQETESKLSSEKRREIIKNYSLTEINKYQNLVQQTIKDVEKTIQLLENDQSELNAINNMLKEEIAFRNYLN